MPNRGTLDPETRILYGDSLQPPPGYVFDAAVATTFSLDFETALAAPVCLALFAAENREDILSNPLALLEGAERIAGRLVVFADAGRLHAQTPPHSRLCSLLERVVVEVAAPRGGAFHPKLWVLRYRAQASDAPPVFRLLVLSRNLTRDRSWDISLRLEGKLGDKPNLKNQPLVGLLARLPGMAVSPAPGHAMTICSELARDIERVTWQSPDQFDDVAFAVNGLDGGTWRPTPCLRLGVISPFCDTDTLNLLARLPTAERPTLISRSDQLAAVDRSTLEAFERVGVLDEMAESEDGEDPSLAELRGLHAKVLVAEVGSNTILTVGSGNATRPALISDKNVELFASLSGRRARVGGVDQIMGSAGFGRLTRKYEPNEADPTDPSVAAAEADLDAARRSLCRDGLILRCERDDCVQDRDKTWQVWLVPRQPIPLPGVASLYLWPITRGSGHRRDALAGLRDGKTIDLGRMPVADLTRFIAFQVGSNEGKANALFSTGLLIEGLPQERHAALLRWMIDSRETFLRYLRLLLTDLGNPFGAAMAASEGSMQEGWPASHASTQLLEDMVRALCQGGERLHAIENLMSRLEPPEEGALDPIPPEFRALWDAFRAVIQTGDATDVR